MNKKGFTFIELVVVLSIIVIVSTMIYANFEGFNRRGEIMNSASKVLDNLRTAQAYGVSGKNVNGQVAYGWGVNVNRNTNTQTVFNDYNNNAIYDYPTKLLIHGSESTLVESSNGHLGIVNTGATQNPSGGMPIGTNGYWSFNGSNNFLTVSTSSFNLNTNSFALDLWFRIPATGSNRTLVQLGSSPNYSFNLYKDSSDKINLSYSYSPGFYYNLQSTSTVTTGTWYYVAVVRDSYKGMLKLFLGKDGDSKVALASTTPISTTQSCGNRDDLYIGQNGSGGAFWTGDIDDIRLITGTPLHNSDFNFPTTEAKSDIEYFKSYKLPPGVVFQRLFNGANASSSINILWRINNPAHSTWVDNVATSSTVIISHAGAEGTGTDRDTPATTTIGVGGAFEKFGF